VITIRRTGDLATVAALDRAIFPDDLPVEVDGATWWIAYDDGEPVGYAGVSWHASTPRVRYFRRAGLLPAYRGQGIGGRLIATRLRWSRRVAREVVTYTAPDNFASMRALISAGFVPHEPAWAYVAGSRWMYWRRDLEAK
jgi:RimJ/RimL family protein N-acetyltransferase